MIGDEENVVEPGKIPEVPQQQSNYLEPFAKTHSLMTSVDCLKKHVCDVLNEDPKLWAVSTNVANASPLRVVWIAAFCECDRGIVLPFQVKLSQGFPERFYIFVHPDHGFDTTEHWLCRNRVINWASFYAVIDTSRDEAFNANTVHLKIENIIKSKCISLKLIMGGWKRCDFPVAFDYNCKKRMFGFIQGSLHRYYDNEDFKPTFHVKRKINIDRDAGDIDEIADIIVNYIPVWEMLRCSAYDYWRETKKGWIENVIAQDMQNSLD